MKLITRLKIGITALVGLSTLALWVQLFIIRKYAMASGADYRNNLITVIVVSVFFIAVSITLTRLFAKAFRDNMEAVDTYSTKLANGETDFKIEDYGIAEFAHVYESYEKILEYNRTNAVIAESIADGDLTVDAVVKSEKDLLGNSLAKLLKKNNEVLSGIRESSYQLTTGAEQVAAASQTLAQGSTEQASAIEEITVSMKDIEHMSQDNAKQANSASEIVVDTKNAASLGNGRMDQMKVAMEEINLSSEKIGKIIKVIDDISFQTNILALNAAVEAARAGTHGKGFAVVAEQIRELAGKSAQAAAETAEMIDDSIVKVHKGTKLTDDTAKALNDIMTGIDRVVDITESIAKASQDQAVAVSQIDQAINQVSMVVQNNSATSEECAAASEELSGQSLALREMISKYRLNGENQFSGRSDSGRSYSSSGSSYRSDVNPADIISLDGDFGKY